MEYDVLPTKRYPGPRTLQLDYASPRELAWWQAIVADGVGWSIAGAQVAPWAISVEDMDVQIGGEIDGRQQPPTTREAACYLARFCSAFGLGSQSSAALAAALSIPLHASTAPLKSVTIELPEPSLTARVATPEEEIYPSDFELISYYMTLSLCPWALGSSLWSIFWEPDVPCNLAGAWIGPIATTLEPIIRQNDLELLAKVLSFTSIAPLWLGLALCGRRALIKSILPSLTELRHYPYTRPDIDTAAWTGVQQSFMDSHCTELRLDDTVPRADVWRLRHDCYAEYSDDGFLYTPPYGWAPFGTMRDSDVELEIRGHLGCCHQWAYSYWTWLPSRMTDTGYSGHTQHYLPPFEVRNQNHRSETHEVKILYNVSETATKAMFWWCCGQVEMGFSALVPRQSRPDEVLGSAESGGHIGVEDIYEWLEILQNTNSISYRR